MARLVKELTGPNETGRWGASATDLGFPAITNHGYTITIFGDTFVDHVGGSVARRALWLRRSIDPVARFWIPGSGGLGCARLRATAQGVSSFLA